MRPDIHCKAPRDHSSSEDWRNKYCPCRCSTRPIPGLQMVNFTLYLMWQGYMAGMVLPSSRVPRCAGQPLHQLRLRSECWHLSQSSKRSMAPSPMPHTIPRTRRFRTDLSQYLARPVQAFESTRSVAQAFSEKKQTKYQLK
jgi:hypothetical protein